MTSCVLSRRWQSSELLLAPEIGLDDSQTRDRLEVSHVESVQRQTEPHRGFADQNAKDSDSPVQTGDCEIRQNSDSLRPDLAVVMPQSLGGSRQDSGAQARSAIGCRLQHLVSPDI